MSESLTIRTIGFTKKSAKKFFGLLRRSNSLRVIDVRLNNVSQLAGFSKKEDLEYFLHELLGITYVHLPILAPTQEMLDAYKKHRGDWPTYQETFLKLMRDREIEKRIDPKFIDDACLLCSEDRPHHCHRRLVAEYLRQQWGSLEIEHLV